jgi:uncharacterized membrane protein YgcG
MTSKKLAILLVLLSFSFSVCGQTSTTYPPAKGIVSDYAGKLSEAQVKELTGLIKQYERKTSIEFAVVVVDSLHGRSVREYAIGLGDFWKIGKGGRNNGVVLLWAPNERAYSLRITDGLTDDLNDSDARLITQQHLLPNFKRGDYYAGLKETVQTTMAYLGDEPWDERIQARANAAEQHRQVQAQAAQATEQARQSEEQHRQKDAENLTWFLWFAGGFLLFWFVVILAGIAIKERKKHRQQLAELATANQTIADLLSTAESNAPQIQKLLDDFSKEAPEQDVTSLRADLAGQPDRIAKIKLDATLLDATKLESYNEMLRLRTNAETESDLKDSVRGRISDIKSAKQQSQALMEQLSQEKFQISDVRDSAKRDEVDRLLLQSQQQYEQARRNSSTSVFDWLIIHDLLTSSQGQVRQAVEYSQQEPYVPSFSSSSGSESSGSSFSSFFSGGSDSSSGGFSGGGDSGGGGGGFSGGSGSDGSY